MILKNFFAKKPHLIAVRYGLFALVATMLSTSFSSCTSDDEDLQGNWVALSTLNGAKRMSATGTTVKIDGKEYGFVGTGIDSEGDRLVDFWKFDPSANTYGAWTQVADFPGLPRTNAVSFSIGGILYVGTGYTNEAGESGKDREYLKDFYKYDPAKNEWTAIADLPTSSGKGIRDCTAFVLGEKAYVGLGYDGTSEYKDFYVFNGKTEAWEGVNSAFPGKKLTGAASFVIDGVAYVGAGTSNTSAAEDFFSFDGKEWDKMHKLTTDDNDDYSKDDDYGNNITRNFTATFVMNGMGYFATSGSNSASQSVWEYNPKNDSWVEKTKFEGSTRMKAVGLTINGIGYVVTGGGSSSSVYDDVWRFEPSADQTNSDN